MNLNATLLGEMITFAIFVWFTLRFVVPPIQKVVEARQEQAQTIETNFAKSKQSLLDNQRAGEEVVAEAKQQAATAIEVAKTTAKGLLAKAESDARVKAAKIAADNETKVKQDYQKMLEDLKANFASDLIIAGVEAVLQDKMTDKLNMQVIDNILAEET